MKDQPRRAVVNIVAGLESVQHDFITRDVRQQPQFKLRIIRRDKFVSRFGNKRPPDAPAQFGANRDVLQVWLTRRQPARRGHGLIQLTMNSPVGSHLMRQSVRVDAL